MVAASKFDFFIALDGLGLNGFEGFGGVARLRCEPDHDRYDIAVRFYDGIAGAHATQINDKGTVGFLGNLSQILFFYDPRTLEEIKRFSTLRFHAPEVFLSSQTHVVWMKEREFITVIGSDFYLFNLDDLEHPERIGAHGVFLPHAIKKSPSGNFLFYGSMDHDKKGYANHVGIFDLRKKEARVVGLPATVWHLQTHPQKDIFYAPTQRCTPQGTDFTEYTIAHFKNYLFEIDGPTATVLRHIAIPKDLPGALTSDVVVTEQEVLYNACASSAIVRVDLPTFSQVKFIDERPTGRQVLRHWRAGVSNLVEAFSRANLPSNTHAFFKAVRIARMSPLDGSFGLALSPCGKYLISAHRGMNEVIVYEYPKIAVRKRIPFPPMRQFYPNRFGRLDDERLGFHHSTLSTATLG